MVKRKKSLRERVLKTMPVVGKAWEMEKLRDYDRFARQAITSELGAAEKLTRKLLQHSVDMGNSALAELINDKLRREINAVLNEIENLPTAYMPSIAETKKVDTATIDRIIDIDESMYDAAYDIREMISGLCEETDDLAPKVKESVTFVWKNAEDIREVVRTRRDLLYAPHPRD